MLLFTPVKLPKYELFVPAVLENPDALPKKALKLALFEIPAFAPKNALLPPIILSRPAKEPKKALLIPLVVALPEYEPKKAFVLPVVMEFPDSNPTEVLSVPVK